MPVLVRSELEASPLADLHAIAGEIGLEGFRRLRKADLIDSILGEESEKADGAAPGAEDGAEDEATTTRPRRRRSPRGRRSSAAGETTAEDTEPEAEEVEDDEEQPAPAARSRGRGRSRGGRGSRSAAREEDADEQPEDTEDASRIAAGVVDVLANGSAFLRVDPPEPSDDDVYISAAQVRRCELVSGDRVTGPVRTPRRSERYPSLVRIDTINGASADEVADGVRYDELPVSWPSERLALDSKDATLEAIEWLTPLGRGSRAVIVGARLAGKTETLRKLAAALQASDGLECSVVLVGARPEEIAEWQEDEHPPAAALSFAASADAQGQAVERAIDSAKRVAARGGDAVVLIDSLDGLNQHAARKALAAARNLRAGGSLTVIATASAPLGGETTVIALDAGLTATGRTPIVDLAVSATLRAELLVGEDGAQAIAKARAAAVEASA